jgi:UDP-N-acetylglucosamine/UDP-N-acetylgalactosamine 4-epimerase
MKIYTSELSKVQKKWLITGVAGFIGSNLLERLLELGQTVVGVDNFSTSIKADFLIFLEELKKKGLSNSFYFHEADIRDYKSLEDIFDAHKNIDYVLHQAAIGSVPRSFDDPSFTNSNNISGFLNVLTLSQKKMIRKFIYASSSSVYGDNLDEIKTEGRIGNQLSPYAVTKYVNELYSKVFSDRYQFQTLGLRYFNVFGPRQRCDGPYSAVIPRWINEMIVGKPTYINGDGLITRDFCFIENVISANILGAISENSQISSVVNVAVGMKISLTKLNNLISNEISKKIDIQIEGPIYLKPRVGDIQNSLASIDLARTLIGYKPIFTLEQGLKKTIDWWVSKLK